MVRVAVLGPVEVTANGRPVNLGGPKERAVLAVLVARGGEVVSVSELADQLWGQHPPRTAAKTLRSYVARLRRELDSARGDDRPSVIVTVGGGYRLDPRQGASGRSRWRR